MPRTFSNKTKPHVDTTCHLHNILCIIANSLQRVFGPKLFKFDLNANGFKLSRNIKDGVYTIFNLLNASVALIKKSVN